MIDLKTINWEQIITQAFSFVATNPQLLMYIGGVLLCFIIFSRFTSNVSLRKAKRPKYINKLNWREFEVLITKYYRKIGYKVKLEGGSGGDGGIDALLIKRGRKTIVQCKHWKRNSVGVAVVREMFGVMVSEKAERVIIVTSGRFTKDSYLFAKGKPIDLVNGEGLSKMMNSL